MYTPRRRGGMRCRRREMARSGDSINARLDSPAYLRDRRRPGVDAIAGPHDGDDARGQVEVDPRAEHDHTEALAPPDGIAGVDPADDPPGDRASDLHQEIAPAAALEDERVALVVERCLVGEGGAELAGRVADLADDT